MLSKERQDGYDKKSKANFQKAIVTHIDRLEKMSGRIGKLQKKVGKLSWDIFVQLVESLKENVAGSQIPVLGGCALSIALLVIP